MSEKKHSFWSTVPGILTGIAAIITAIGGLLVVLSQTGILGSNENKGVVKGRVPVEVTESFNGQPPKNRDTTPQDTTTEIRGDTSITKNLASDITNSEVVRINLLSSENGGQVLAATSDQWLKTIDEKEKDFAFYESNGRAKTEAVYAFKGERSAEFDTFTVLVLDAQNSNLKDFELLWGNESATGKFHSIGKFQTQNIKLFTTPYQEFKFSPVTAKYLKVRLLSSWVYALINVREFQLMGALL